MAILRGWRCETSHGLPGAKLLCIADRRHLPPEWRIDMTPVAPRPATKLAPFGAHFTTKLEGVNNKLVCALSNVTSCADDHPPLTDPNSGPVNA